MKTQKPSFTICSSHVKPQKGCVLILDVGTTGIKAFVFDGSCRVLAKSYRQISKSRHKRGWFEQDPMEILRVSVAVMRKVLKNAGRPLTNMRGVGITNQREATVLWDKQTGKPVYPIIGWEDTRTRRYCRSFSKQDQQAVREATGLPIDSYFSASKIRWILEHAPEARKLAVAGQLAFGTIDSWLLWNLCEGQPHVTDETNAARTLLFNIRPRQWDQTLLNLFKIPASILPTVYPSRACFGVFKKDVVGSAIPVLAVCGDQQASTYAAMRRASTMIPPVTKITYGTGIFMVQLLGTSFRLYPSFLTTLVPAPHDTIFAVEHYQKGSGEAVERALADPHQLEKVLRRLAQQTTKMIQRLPKKPKTLIVDGGIARDGIIVQALHDATGIPTFQQTIYDGTALGTAMLVWEYVGRSYST